MTTKAELNARLATPLTASKLKKTSLADMQTMVDAQKAKPARKPRGLDDRVILEPGKVEDVRPTDVKRHPPLRAKTTPRFTRCARRGWSGMRA